MNKKLRRLAIKSALSTKLAEGKLIVVDSIAMDEYKTKTVVNMLTKIGAGKSLIVNGEHNNFFIKSAANIQGIKAALTNTINTYDILKYDNLVLTADAVKKIEEVYA
jgi:large subunit ribosomal protein L4